MARTGRKSADDLIIFALAAGGSREAAAKHAKVSLRTVYRRLEDPDFVRRIQATRDELVGRAVGQLSASATEAVTTLRSLLSAESEMARLGAARSILQLLLETRQQEELSRRVASLEALNQLKGSEAWKV